MSFGLLPASARLAEKSHDIAVTRCQKSGRLAGAFHKPTKLCLCLCGQEVGNTQDRNRWNLQIIIIQRPVPRVAGEAFDGCWFTMTHDHSQKPLTLREDARASPPAFVLCSCGFAMPLTPTTLVY